MVLPRIPYGSEITDDVLDALAADATVADHIFDSLDADGNGSISCEELGEFLLSRDAWLTQEKVQELFAALDKDKNGRITRKELRAGLKGKPGGKRAVLWLIAVRPPATGKAVYADLVRPGGPVAIPDAARRAIKLGQLKKVNAHARRRCEAEVWLGKRFDDKGDMRIVRLDPDELNLYDVATHVILPATYAYRLPDGVTRPSLVELLADGPQPPDYFVSVRRRGGSNLRLPACA